MIGKLRWPDKHFSRIRRIWGIDSVHSPVGRPYTCSFRQHRKKAFAFLIAKPTFILGILGLYNSRNHLSIGSPKISWNAFQPDTASRKSDVCNPSRLFVGKMSCPISIFPVVLGALSRPQKYPKGRNPRCFWQIECGSGRPSPKPKQQFSETLNQKNRLISHKPRCIIGLSKEVAIC